MIGNPKGRSADPSAGMSRPLDTELVQSDEQLMRAVQRGDLGSYEELVARHQSTVYGLCLTMLRSREDAEEAVQDSFLKLFRARDRFDPARRLEPWLLRIAGNTCRDALRRRRAEPPRATTDSDQLAQILVDPRSTQLERRDAMKQLVQHEVGRLSERLRLPLQLRYEQGLNNSQIAESLGISLSNVKVRLAEAKDLMQGRLQRAQDGDPDVEPEVQS